MTFEEWWKKNHKELDLWEIDRQPIEIAWAEATQTERQRCHEIANKQVKALREIERKIDEAPQRHPNHKHDDRATASANIAHQRIVAETIAIEIRKG